MIGYLKTFNWDMPWIYGKFRAGPDFERYAHHFARALELREAYDAMDIEEVGEATSEAALEKWFDALHVITLLGLKWKGTPICDFRINRDGTCDFKWA